MNGPSESVRRCHGAVYDLNSNIPLAYIFVSSLVEELRFK
jgi:hypothetical protein